MLNDEIYTLNIPRIAICDIELALLHVRFGFEDEAGNATDEDSRKRALNNAAKWERLHDLVSSQLYDQDAKRGY